MRFDSENDVYHFEATGNQALAHGGVIGINPTLEVFQGYDGPFAVHNGGAHTPDPRERVELAVDMIERWAKFMRQSVRANNNNGGNGGAKHE